MSVQVLHYYGPRSTAFYIMVPFIAQGTETVYTGAAPANTDCLYFPATPAVGVALTNAPAICNAGQPGYYLLLTAAEMGEPIFTVVIDNANIDPVYIIVETTFKCGPVVINNPSGDAISATSTGSNGYGFKGTPHGTGQVSNILDQTEGTEPAGAIASDATFKAILQHLKRRFFNKVTQTEATQTIYKDDSTTSLETMTVSDDGTTQSKGKAS